MKKKELKEVKAEVIKEVKVDSSERLERLEVLIEKVILKLNQVPGCGDKIYAIQER